jgi:uncharacterized membrane protein
MTTPSIGPVELLVLKFPGNQFKGEIAPALNDLVQSGTIRIIDLIFAIRDENGKFDLVEIKELEDNELEVFEPLLTGGTELLSQEDIEDVAAMIEDNSSAAILLFENAWATRFRDTLANANAEVIHNTRIPHTVVQELLAEKAERENLAPVETTEAAV